MKTIDLHTHTTASDGTFTPVELVKHAINKKLSAVAITDHDNMDGIKEAIDYVDKSKLTLEIIPGIEISTYADGLPYGLHILGYFIDKNEEELKHLIMNIKKDLRKINETPQEAIKLIAQYGGFSSLAHPKDCFMSMGSLEKLVEKLKSFGLNGMECIYTTHSDKEIEQFKEIAARNNLIVTGGTDFHGLRKPGVELGSGYGELIIPYDILNSLKK